MDTTIYAASVRVPGRLPHIVGVFRDAATAWSWLAEHREREEVARGAQGPSEVYRLMSSQAWPGAVSADDPSDPDGDGVVYEVSAGRAPLLLTRDDVDRVRRTLTRHAEIVQTHMQEIRERWGDVPALDMLREEYDLTVALTAYVARVWPLALGRAPLGYAAPAIGRQAG